MANGIQDYAALLQQLTPAPQVPINSAQVPPFIAAPQAPPPTGVPAAPGAPVQAPQQGAAPQGQPKAPTRSFTEAPPTDDSGMSGLDQFLAGASDSTNSGRFLMDLGMKLLQDPQQGQSQLAHIAAAGSSALNKLEQAKASEAAAKGATELRESRLATEKRTLESADLGDALTRAKIRDLDEKKGGKAPAAKVQEINQRAQDLLTNHPELYKTLPEAREAAVRQVHVDDVEKQRAKAISAYLTNNVLIRTEEEQQADLKKIHAQYDKQIAAKPFDPIPQSTALPGKPAAAAGGSKRDAMVAEITAVGREGVGDWLRQRKPDATDADIAQLTATVFGKEGKTKPKTKPQVKPKPKRGDSPQTRKARVEARRAAIMKSRAAGKAKTASVKAERQKAKDEASGYLDSTFPSLSKKEMRRWFTKNRKHLSSTEVRKATRTMRKAKGL